MRKNLTIHIFGNELLDFDNLPIKLAPKLKKLFPHINFIIQDPNENIKLHENGELVVIDTVMGIDRVSVIYNVEKLETEKIYSMHDFDLAFNLKLLKKTGELKKLAIFGVPPAMSEREASEQLVPLIKKHFEQ